MDENVFLLTIIDIRYNVPDAYTTIYRNKEDAIQVGIRYANDNGCGLHLSDQDKYLELDDGDGLDLSYSIYILPIETKIIN